MATQTLKFKAGQPIVIPTPSGLIKIHRLDSRSFRFELPAGIRAFKGEERAVMNQPKVFTLGVGETIAASAESTSDPHLEE